MKLWGWEGGDKLSGMGKVPFIGISGTDSPADMQIINETVEASLHVAFCCLIRFYFLYKYEINVTRISNFADAVKLLCWMTVKDRCRWCFSVVRRFINPV